MCVCVCLRVSVCTCVCVPACECVCVCLGVCDSLVVSCVGVVVAAHIYFQQLVHMGTTMLYNMGHCSFNCQRVPGTGTIRIDRTRMSHHIVDSFSYICDYTPFPLSSSLVISVSTHLCLVPGA